MLYRAELRLRCPARLGAGEGELRVNQRLPDVCQLIQLDGDINIAECGDDEQLVLLPGVEDVMASLLLPLKLLISDDLPTFDLPMNANSGNRLFGFCETFVLLPANFASETFISEMMI